MTGTSDWHAEVDERLGLLRIILTGTFDLEAWRLVLERLPEAPGLRPGMPTLVDARKAELRFFYDDTPGLVALVKTYLGKRGGDYRSAWVVASDSDYGVSRMVQTTLAELPIEASIFRDIGEAQAWVVAAD